MFDIKKRELIEQGRADEIKKITNNLVVTKLGNQYGFIDLELIPSRCYIQRPHISDYKYYPNGIVCVSKNKYGILNPYTAKTVLDFKFDSLGKVNSTDVLVYKLGTETGLMNIKGEKMYSFESDTQMEQTFRGFLFRKRGLVGYVNTYGKLLLDAQYDNIEEVLIDSAFESGRGIRPIDRSNDSSKSYKIDANLEVKKGKFTGVYKNDKMIIPCIYQNIRYTINGFFVKTHTNKKGFIGENGNIYLEPLFDVVTYFDQKEGEYTRLLFKKDGYEGLTDLWGKIIIPCDYRMIERSQLNDYAKVKSKNGLYGWINFKTGENIINPQYESVVGDFKDRSDRVVVNKNGKTFRIRSDGRVSKGFLTDIWDDLFNN